MRFIPSIIACLLLAGCAAPRPAPVYSPLPAAPAKPSLTIPIPDPAQWQGDLVTGPVPALAATSEVITTFPVIIEHVQITGSEAERLTLPMAQAYQASNYIFELQGTTNLSIPAVQWAVSYPAGWTNISFWITNAAPAAYFRGEFQPVAQPGVRQDAGPTLEATP